VTVAALSHARREVLDRAVLRAKLAAYPPGEFVGQESFMTAGEILDLARRAGVGPGVGVLDVCCGVAGPGRLVTRQLGCDYLGVDASAPAIALARDRAAATGLACAFRVGSVPPLPAGRFDVVLLFETLLAFADKEPLLATVAAALRPGGRFAFTVEEGVPMSPAEAAAMPDADTVWPIRLEQVHALLDRVGLQIRWQGEHTAEHLLVVEALVEAFAADAEHIRGHVGGRAVEDLIAAHRLWAAWLAGGRIRKFAVVAERAECADA
jgi:SAM-dependent methyltransferase